VTFTTYEGEIVAFPSWLLSFITASSDNVSVAVTWTSEPRYSKDVNVVLLALNSAI